MTADGWVVELQHSYLSPAEIREREDFYGQRMVWLFDATQAGISIRQRDRHVTFRWRHPRKTITACRRPLWLDLGGNRILGVRKIYPVAPCGGWGHIVHTDAVRSWMCFGTPLESAG